MRLGAALVIFALVLAGCSAPATELTADEEKPISTRTSRTSASGGTTTARGVQIPTDDARYNLTRLLEFEIRFPKGPNDPPTPTQTYYLNGSTNRSFIRVESTFFINGMNPVHSGLLLGTIFLGGGPVPVTQAPTMTGVWGDGTLLVTHSHRQFVPIPNPNGYHQAGAAQKTYKVMPEYPTPASFGVRGWGDIYVKVAIDEALLRESPNKKET